MLKKLLPFLAAILLLTACTKPSDLELVYNPIRGLETGTWQMALIVEATTNFSSLLYDKTEAKFDSFTVHSFQVLPQGASYYIMPAICTNEKGKSYDDAYINIMASYLRLNAYGKKAATPEEADYIIVIEIAESPEKFHGVNSSTVSVSIFEPDENPVFYVKAAVQSKSDSNFYYYPSKGARPVKYLTLKGFEKIFHEGIPQAFS